jgi:hypothetical protein
MCALLQLIPWLPICSPSVACALFLQQTQYGDAPESQKVITTRQARAKRGVSLSL